MTHGYDLHHVLLNTCERAILAHGIYLLNIGKTPTVPHHRFGYVLRGRPLYKEKEKKIQNYHYITISCTIIETVTNSVQCLVDFFLSINKNFFLKVSSNPHLPNISFNSCSETNWPRFATNNVEQGGLLTPIPGCDDDDPTGEASAGLGRKWGNDACTDVSAVGCGRDIGGCKNINIF